MSRRLAIDLGIYTFTSDVLPAKLSEHDQRALAQTLANQLNQTVCVINDDADRWIPYHCHVVDPQAEVYDEATDSYVRVTT